MKKFDEVMQSLNMTPLEVEIVSHIFEETDCQDLRSTGGDLCVRHDSRKWFDPCSGTGITPEVLVKRLRKEAPKDGFEDHQMWECDWHLAVLPKELHSKLPKN